MIIGEHEAIIGRKEESVVGYVKFVPFGTDMVLYSAMCSFEALIQPSSNSP